MARRSCDVCVRRKTRCDNAQPCGKCLESKEPQSCTYLNPVLKRGPKAPRRGRPNVRPPRPIAKRVSLGARDPTPLQSKENLISQDKPIDTPSPLALQSSVLVSIIGIYKRRMYPVWPVVNAQELANRLRAAKSVENDGGAYILATALCAATIAQLKLDDAEKRMQNAGAKAMEQECTVLRNACNYRERPCMDNVLASFFLHVYHAKIDNRKAAMMSLQEAIYFARMLRLDDAQSGDGDTKKGLVYLLLWVSERYVIEYWERIENYANEYIVASVQRVCRAT